MNIFSNILGTLLKVTEVVPSSISNKEREKNLHFLQSFIFSISQFWIIKNSLVFSALLQEEDEEISQFHAGVEGWLMWFYSVYNSLRRIAKRHIDFTLYTDFHYFKHFIAKKNWPSFYLHFTSVIQTCLVPFFVLIYDVEWKAIESTPTLCTWYLTRVGENESLFSFPMQDVTLRWSET